VESRTIYPIIARPVTRGQYLAGKYVGTLLTVVCGLAAMGLLFGLLIFAFQGTADWSLGLVMFFAIIEVAVVAAVATAISVFATPATSSVLTFMVFVAGTIKMGYFGEMLSRMHGGGAKVAMGLVYHLLPNLECFNIKNVLVHQESVPTAYLAQVLVYGIIYSTLVLLIGATRFFAKEV
jgi:Cu-processing system permease protein